MSDDPKLEELDKLISTGKQKGYVTYEELNDALPGDLISSYQLDDIMLMFGAMDIDVVDSAKARRLTSPASPSQMLVCALPSYVASGGSGRSPGTSMTSTSRRVSDQ